MPANLIDYGPQLPTANANAAAAAGGALADVGKAITNIGSEGLDIHKQIRRADEGAKLAKFRSEKDKKVNEFNMGLMSRQDYDNWAGELDGLLSDDSGMPEGLSNEARFAFTQQNLEYNSRAHDKIALTAMTRKVEEAKAMTLFAAQEAHDRGNTELGVDILNSQGAGIFAPSELAQATSGMLRESDTRKIEGAINGGVGDVNSMKTLVDDSEAWHKAYPNATQDDYLRAKAQAQQAYERNQSEGIRDINQRDDSGEFQTPDQYKAALESDPRIPKSEHPMLLRSFNNTQPLNGEVLFSKQGEVNDIAQDYLDGTINAKEFEARKVEAYNSISSMGRKRDGVPYLLSDIKSLDIGALDRIKESRNGGAALKGKDLQASLKIGLQAHQAQSKENTGIDEKDVPKVKIAPERASAEARATAESLDAAAAWGVQYQAANPTKTPAEVNQATIKQFYVFKDAANQKFAGIDMNGGTPVAPTNSLSDKNTTLADTPAGKPGPAPVVGSKEAYVPKPEKEGGFVGAVKDAAVGLIPGGPVVHRLYQTVTSAPPSSNLTVAETPAARADGTVPGVATTTGPSASPLRAQFEEKPPANPDAAPDAFGKPATKDTSGVIPQGPMDGKLYRLTDSGQWLESGGLIDGNSGGTVDATVRTNQGEGDAPVTFNAASPEVGTLNLIKSFEGFSANAYADGAQTSIGYGTVGKKGETITKEEAEVRLNKGVSMHQRIVEREAVRRGIQLTPQQLAAMTSFSYNTGKADRAFAAGDSPMEWANYMKGIRSFKGKRLRGLERRRIAEAALMGVTIAY